MPFNLEEVLDNLASLITVKAHEKEGIEVLFCADPDVPRALVGDPLRLGQVLINLSNNAVKFTEHGEIVVSTELVGRGERTVEIKFAVKDTGIGLDRGAEGQAVHLLLPGRHLDHPQVRRHGAGPGDQQAPGGVDGRPDLGRKRARPGQHVLLHRGLRDRPRTTPHPAFPAAGPEGPANAGGRRQLDLARDPAGDAGVVLLRGDAGGFGRGGVGGVRESGARPRLRPGGDGLEDAGDRRHRNGQAHQDPCGREPDAAHRPGDRLRPRGDHAPGGEDGPGRVFDQAGQPVGDVRHDHAGLRPGSPAGASDGHRKGAGGGDGRNADRRERAAGGGQRDQPAGGHGDPLRGRDQGDGGRQRAGGARPGSGHDATMRSSWTFRCR